ncbi:rap1 gtpase-gdp dissociation stimulator 1 [Anaeramoeba ignava]|uniref:Rap1 gtpase-gdp dissociation stimulator 1 n=1 Tax=Anaeramoeba ignava TaxID=1746090 RepID=A0A9Q0LQF0_ANAIG|nr:rap1 gtpase-gdp dissociation stimulator 1 [Anaeramoeba ignava]
MEINQQIISIKKLFTEKNITQLISLLNQILSQQKSNSNTLSLYVENGLLTEMTELFQLNSQKITYLVLEILGELTFYEGNRSKISNNQIFEHVISLFDKNDTEIWRLIIRLFANLCVDSDENQEKIHQKKIIDKVLKVFQNTSTTETNLLRSCVVFILNMSFGNAEIQLEFGKKQAIVYLVSLLKIKNQKELLILSLRALSVLMELKENHKYLANINYILSFLEFMENLDGEIQELSFEIFYRISSEEKCRLEIINNQLILRILSLEKLNLSPENLNFYYRFLAYLSLEEKATQIMIEQNCHLIASKLMESQDIEIVISSVMWLGNLIRTEQNRIHFQDFPNMIKSMIELSSDQRIQSQYLSVSALSWLSLNPRIAKMISEMNGFTSLMKVIKGKYPKRVRYCASRIITNIVLNTESQEKLCNFIKNQLSYAISYLMKSEYNTLKFEGISILRHLTTQETTKNCLFSNHFKLEGIKSLLHSQNNDILDALSETLISCLDNNQAKKVLFKIIDDLKDASLSISINTSVETRLQECFKILELQKEEKRK